MYSWAQGDFPEPQLWSQEQGDLRAAGVFPQKARKESCGEGADSMYAWPSTFCGQWVSWQLFTGSLQGPRTLGPGYTAECLQLSGEGS